jgi:hypothetical protein
MEDDMKKFVVPAVLMLAGTVACHADADKKITEAQLPVAARTTAHRETTGATVKGYLTEVEHGVRVYEVETVVSGHTRDLQIIADGTLTEVEEEVPFDGLSASVKIGLTTRAKDAKIVKVESLTKGGKLVAYEASTLKGSHHGGIQVGPDGKSLSHEE